MWNFFKRKNKEPSLKAEQKKSWRLWRRNLVRSQEAMSEEARVATSQLEEVYENQLREVMVRMEKEFGNTLAGEVAAFTKRLEDNLVVETDKAKLEIADHKKAMIEKAKTDMEEILEQVSGKVISKKLSFSDQVDLINEALEQAKKEKFIL